MKLLFCPHCTDVFNLVLEVEKKCRCGQVKGKYIDKTNAVSCCCSGSRGIFIECARQNFQKDASLDFTAFTISKSSPAFKKE